MAWELLQWACGHKGRRRMYCKIKNRSVEAAREADRDCLACWLIKTWLAKNDPRAGHEDTWDRAVAVAEGNGIHICGAPPKGLLTED